MSKNGMDLFEEKNLWTIYKSAVVKLPASKFNTVATIFIFILLILDCIIFPGAIGGRIRIVRELADSGLGFGSTILGFLIAGFTIFATITKPELFVLLYNSKDEKINLSNLKVSFFAFVEVFVVYIAFLICCLVVKLIAGSGGFVSSLVGFTENSSYFCWKIDRALLINFSFICLGTLSFYSLLALKSFVYNIYHTVIISIVWILNPPDSK